MYPPMMQHSHPLVETYRTPYGAQVIVHRNTVTLGFKVMEGIHGVDVSWLHHSNKEHHHRIAAPSSPGLSRDKPPKTSSHGGIPAEVHPVEPASPVKPIQNEQKPNAQIPSGAVTSADVPNGKPAKRPNLLGRSSTDKLNGAPESKEEKGSRLRRNSWVNSISSKFSSSNAQAPASPAVSQAEKKGTSAITPPPTPPATSPAINGGAQSGNDKTDGYTPSPPKGSFFSNALKRLSSGTQMSPLGKGCANGGLCPRRVLNVNPDRERVLIPELDQNKLRRVAFSVDVEIAGGPKYKDDGGDEEKKKKRKKLKERGEGEALKNPQAVADKKDEEGKVPVSGEDVGNEREPNPEGTVSADAEPKEPVKKEKKHRTEEEKRAREERKRQKAEQAGQRPRELVSGDDQTPENQTPALSGASTPKPQDRPTTDPLRIYRRCCQLRETPILKRISEQLANPQSCPADTPGIISCLDLTGSRLQHADFQTLSDWLAIVPVKKLLLEDANMGDEEVRVVLAGLLAAKSPEYGLRTRVSQAHPLAPHEKHGVVEKLSLKNNPKMTKEAWKHISLFIYMCRSLKALDVSMVRFPIYQPPQESPASSNSAISAKPGSADVAEIFCKALSERLAGDQLEELIMAECHLSAYDIRKIVDGVSVCGLKRLGLAGNDIDEDGLQHVVRYIRSGVCMGLDLGGNNLRNLTSKLVEAMNAGCTLFALSLADCNLTAECLRTLFPALVPLNNFKFLDLSHNHELFALQNSAMQTLRKYLPQLQVLKRLHIADCSLTPAQAIGLAEVLPECAQLAHLNILENPQISALARATDEAGQEEACALYVSLMSAVRASHSLVCIDIDVPSHEASDIVKALAKQVVAYCLRNMERYTNAEVTTAEVTNAVNEQTEKMEKEVMLPEVLMHLVGHGEGIVGNHDDDPPAPDEDYIVGGTGVVKALSYCLLEKEQDGRRISMPSSGTATPRSRDGDSRGAKAKVVSSNLLDSARRIKQRLQPALREEAQKGDELAYKRLLFLDQTLTGMIHRFEDEYPECRIPETKPLPGFSLGGPAPGPDETASQLSLSPPESYVSADISTPATGQPPSPGSDSDQEDDAFLRPSSRRASDVSLVARSQTDEEGRIHRLGQRLRRDILKPEYEDHHHGTTGKEEFPDHIQALREKFFTYSGEELRENFEKEGFEGTVANILGSAEELRKLKESDPVGFEKFREAQLSAQRNVGIGDSAVEIAGRLDGAT